MQRPSKVLSILLTTLQMKQASEMGEVGIRSEFLNLATYKSTVQFSQRRHECYVRYCSLIRSYYCDFHAAAKHLSDRIKIAPNDQLDSVKQFKQHLIDLVKALEEVASFKIEFYDQLQDSELDPIRRPTDEIMYRVGKYAETQGKYQQAYETLKGSQGALVAAYTQAKKEVRNPALFFDLKYTRPKVAQLQGLMKAREAAQAEAAQLLDTVYKNAGQFEADIGNYRQRVVSAKYKTHKKLAEMSKGARECLTQTLLTLFQIVAQREAAFQGLLRESVRESTLLIKYKRRGPKVEEGTTDKLAEIIISATQEYNDLINSVEAVIKTLIDGFALFSANSKDRNDAAKALTEELNKLYETDENPTPDMLDTLDLFSYFCQRMGELAGVLHLQLAGAVKLRGNINKHSQITLSLLKCKGKLDVGPTPKSGSGKNLDQLNNLFDQLSYDYINDIMEKVFKGTEDVLSKLKNYFNAKYHKKKKNRLEDSMDVSHIEEETPHPQKRPSKQEMWLWKDFRNSEKYKKMQADTALLQDIVKFMQPFIDMKVENEKEVDKFNCSLLLKKEVKGVLRILQKNLLFASSNNEVDINVPIDYICEVQARIKTFEKELSVGTSMGEITFAHFPEISKAEVLLQQQMNANTSKAAPKKVSVQITPEEQQFIASRKQQVEAEREPLEGYQEKASVMLEDTTIDAVYDLVYSDKPFKFRGKEECTYFAYILKKNNGSNYTTTKYDPPGPKFYSLEDGRTFINTPLVSTRTNEYEVPLPPIPFMPKTCTNKESVKIFWVSHEQFDYLIRSQSKGAPYADTFYLNIYHKVVKRDKGVEIKIYFKITFVKDGAMRGMIASKSEEEVKNRSQFLLAETSKMIKIVGGGDKGKEEKDGKQGREEQKEEGEKSVGDHPKMKKLESQNKILIGVLVAIIVINLILRLF